MWPSSIFPGRLLMQADIDELVHVWFTGKMMDMLLEIDLEM